jgi:hypothetical protein
MLEGVGPIVLRMSPTFDVVIVEDGPSSPVVALTILRGSAGGGPWEGVLSDAPTQPPGARLTLRFVAPGPWREWTMRVTVAGGAVSGGQRVLGAEPLRAPTAKRNGDRTTHPG